MTAIVMPQIGHGIPSGEIVQWLKRENDLIEKGEVVLLVESDKAVFEVEAQESGVLLKILHGEGEEVEILRPLGFIGEPGESVEGVPEEPAGAADIPAASTDHRAEPGTPVPVPGRMPASPAARRLAREHGVDLARIQGSGPGGRIVRRDVLTASPEGDEVVPFGKVRKRIAERLTSATQAIPHFHLFVDVDMTDAMIWRRRANDEEQLGVTVTDLIIKAVAMALRKYPRLNAHVCEDSLVLKKAINIGVVVSVEDGLLVPVIADADGRSLREISELSKRHADAARRNVLIPGPDGTFTVTSLGMHGIRQFVPVINPPECAILAVGSVEPRAVPIGDEIGVRDMMTLTLACDHRAVDGAEAAGLLNEIKAGLEGMPDTAGRWL